jgi:hypothetical protein
MIKTPWAIILCKWKETTTEPRPLAFFQRLFTSSGIGTNNMVDFFDQMSHGNLDLSGSQVFGWYTLNKPQSAYVGNATAGAGQLDRQGLVNLAKQTAIDAGVPLSTFYGVVVCMNTPTDLFGGGGIQALCDPNSFRPAVLGQEMGHGYGMNHSRRDGSTADYTDQWDVMSTWDGCYISSHPEYTEIGPGLNAANMRGQGWLDETRVWKMPVKSFNKTVELRPLYRRDLLGALAAEIVGLDGTKYLLEYRTKRSWDAAIPRAAILIHRFEAGQSYLMSGTKGVPDLVAGDSFMDGDAKSPFYLKVDVVSINETTLTATLHIQASLFSFRIPERYYEPLHLDIPVPWAGSIVSGGVLVDGGGYAIIGGRIIRIPPWSPMQPVLEQLVAYQAADALTNSNGQIEAKRTALLRLQNHLDATLARTEVLHSPAPRTRAGQPAKSLVKLETKTRRNGSRALRRSLTKRAP